MKTPLIKQMKMFSLGSLISKHVHIQKTNCCRTKYRAHEYQKSSPLPLFKVRAHTCM